MTASRTTPTLWVLVIITGPSRKPDSSTQVVPVISPLPLSGEPAGENGDRSWILAARKDGGDAGADGTFADLTVCRSPEMSVVWPTSTPATSVMALSGPGVPSKGTPRSRARGFGTFGFADCPACAMVQMRKEMRRAGKPQGFWKIAHDGIHLQVGVDTDSNIWEYEGKEKIDSQQTYLSFCVVRKGITLGKTFVSAV